MIQPSTKVDTKDDMDICSEVVDVDDDTPRIKMRIYPVDEKVESHPFLMLTPEESRRRNMEKFRKQWNQAIAKEAAAMAKLAAEAEELKKASECPPRIEPAGLVEEILLLCPDHEEKKARFAAIADTEMNRVFRSMIGTDLEVPMQVYFLPEATQRDVLEYLSTLTPIERKGYEIARNHLGPSFSIERSNGFKKWKKEKSEKDAKKTSADSQS